MAITPYGGGNECALGRGERTGDPACGQEAAWGSAPVIGKRSPGLEPRATALENVSVPALARLGVC